MFRVTRPCRLMRPCANRGSYFLGKGNYGYCDVLIFWHCWRISYNITAMDTTVWIPSIPCSWVASSPRPLLAVIVLFLSILNLLEYPTIAVTKQRILYFICRVSKENSLQRKVYAKKYWNINFQWYRAYVIKIAKCMPFRKVFTIRMLYKYAFNRFWPPNKVRNEV